MRKSALLYGFVHSDNWCGRVGEPGVLVGGLVERVPLLFEIGELLARVRGKVAHERVATQSAAYNIFEEILTQGDETFQTLDEGRGEHAVEDFGDDPEGKEFQIFGWVDELPPQVSASFEIPYVGFDVSANHGDVLCHVVVHKRDLSDGTDRLPVLAANKANAFA